MAIYILLLLIAAIIAYGIGSMDTLVLASNFVFHTNLRKLGKGSSFVSNFRRVYGWKGVLMLLAVELVKDLVPILIGGLLLAVKKHFPIGCAFAGFCIVIGRLWPIFYSLKGSNAILPLIVAGMFMDKSIGIAVAAVAIILVLWTKRLPLAAFAGAFVMIAVSVLVIDEKIILILSVLTAAAVLLRHIPAVHRILKGFGEKLEFGKEDLSYKFDEDFKNS